MFPDLSKWRNSLVEGSIIDVLLREDEMTINNSNRDIAFWTRAKICELGGSSIKIMYLGTGMTKYIELHSSNILPLNTFSTDYEWRESLKVDDEIDFLDSRSWYHSTVLEASEEPPKRIKYGLRVFRENGKSIDRHLKRNYFGWGDTFDLEVFAHHPKLRR